MYDKIRALKEVVLDVLLVLNQHADERRIATMKTRHRQVLGLVSCFVLGKCFVGCGGETSQNRNVEPTTGSQSSAMVNGVADTSGIPIANYGCSAILIAPRTLLTAGHCVPSFVMGCKTLAESFSTVYFPRADGTADPDDAADPNGVRVAHVIAARKMPGVGGDLSTCSSSLDHCSTTSVRCGDLPPDPGCLNDDAAARKGVVYRPNDAVILYLDREAPADLSPIKVLVDASVVGKSPQFVTFPGIRDWVKTHYGTKESEFDPVRVTIAGSGAGTTIYQSVSHPERKQPGKAAGIEQWIGTESSSWGRRWTSCNTFTEPSSLDPSKKDAILLRAPDILLPLDIPAPTPDQEGVPDGTNRSSLPSSFMVDGAIYSAAAGGDSGGPVLVGNDGSTYFGTNQASDLPDPADGSTYALHTRYLAGIAEFNTWLKFGGNWVSGDTYMPTYNVDISNFLADALVDQDGDGIPDDADPFPTCVVNSDVDGDGICDADDLCPCSSLDGDPAQTNDRDGLCAPCDAPTGAIANGQLCGLLCGALGPSPVVYDTCVGVTSTLLENANSDSERVNNARVLGDVCEPVPTPKFKPLYDTDLGFQAGGTTPGGIISGSTGTRTWTGVQTRHHKRISKIDNQFRGSFQSTDEPVHDPQELAWIVNKTQYRYCFNVAGSTGIPEVACMSDTLVSEALLKQATNRTNEDNTTPWHRISLDKTGGSPNSTTNINPFLPSTLYSTENDAPTAAWDVVNDFRYWANTSWGIKIGIYFPVVGDSNLWGGRLWANSDTQLGMTQSFGTGIHHDALGVSSAVEQSNHYEKVDGIILEEKTTHYDLLPQLKPAYWWTFCGACEFELPNPDDDSCPGCAGPLSSIDPGIQNQAQLVVKMPAGIGVPEKTGILRADGSIAPLDDKLSTELSDALSAPGLVWAGHEEALPYVVQGAARPSAVALSQDGTSLAQKVFLRGHSFISSRGLSGDVVGFAAESVSQEASTLGGVAPEARSNFQAVYSRAHGKVFVVGGENPTTHLPLGTIWWRSVDGFNSWKKVGDQGYSPSKVLAATYSYRDGHLWILDEVAGIGNFKKARLVRLDPTSGEFEQVGMWPRLGVYNRFWLFLDKDGEVLFTASSDLLKMHSTFRFDNHQANHHLDRVLFEPGALAYRPLVDQEGYSFIVNKKPNKDIHDTETVRRTSLGGVPASWSHLSGCW